MQNENPIELIIDRVGDVNIFNVINNGEFVHSGDLKVSVDEELINEYLLSIEKTYNVVYAEKEININNKTRLEEFTRLSHELYLQIFPASVKNLLKNNPQKHLFLKLDENAFKIPFELFYDSEKFLCEKYFVARSLKEESYNKQSGKRDYPIKILIICDPSGTLEFAEKETAILKEFLLSRFSNSELKIEVIRTEEIPKLKIIDSMKNADIIHFIGHSFDTGIIEETGWKIGKNKILSAKEIAGSGIKPWLVFSHSCKSAGSIAKAFLQTGVKNFVGCRFNLLDTQEITNFMTDFYDKIFSDIPVSKAFNKALNSHNSSKILSLNYVLFSTVDDNILHEKQNRIKKNFINQNEVLTSYPYQIAFAYNNLLITVQKNDSLKIFENLNKLLTSALRFFSYIIMNDLDRHSIPSSDFLEKLENPFHQGWKDFLYAGLSDLINLRLDLEIPEIADVFYLQKENIEKCISFSTKYRNKEITDNDIPEINLAFQYLLENFLIDISFITSFDFFYITDDGMNGIYTVLSLKGCEKKIKTIETKSILFKNQTLMYNEKNSVIINLSEFFKISEINKIPVISVMSGITKGVTNYETL